MNPSLSSPLLPPFFPSLPASLRPLPSSIPPFLSLPSSLSSLLPLSLPSYSPPSHSFLHYPFLPLPSLPLSSLLPFLAPSSLFSLLLSSLPSFLLTSVQSVTGVSIHKEQLTENGEEVSGVEGEILHQLTQVLHQLPYHQNTL